MVDDVLSRNASAATFAQRLRDETATRLIDWVDAIAAPASDELARQLAECGFVDEAGVHVNRGGIFPRFRLHRGGAPTALEIKVDDVADFVAAWNIRAPVEGEAYSRYRRALAWSEGGTEIWAVERHGYRGFDLAEAQSGRPADVIATLETFRTRRRGFGDEDDADAQGYAHVRSLVEHSPLPAAHACDLFFQAEREYWMSRNRAAQVQYARQQRLGLGWANHDHHTYRCSRRNFARLVGIWELLGFQCRERFYAGREAGWGAQVMEQPDANLVTFNDVDLSPEELVGDFAHQPLAERDSLGTVGLWCGLHGDSLLQAGMHHLECQFDFDLLVRQLASEHHIRVMKPFTDFPYLRQAFTEGQRWPVDPARIRRLLGRGQITPAQAEQFRAQGAIGSHLENLQRDEGFKGFNQTGVSEIIAATDPRKHLS